MYGHYRVIIKEKFVLEERCEKREFEDERNMLKWIECCVDLGCVHCGCAHVLHMKMALIDSQRVDDGTAEECQKGKGLGKDKEGESGLREKSIFLLLCDCCLSLHLFAPFNPPCQHSSSCTLTCSHHTSHIHTCVLSSFFVCDCVHSFHTQSNNTTPCNKHPLPGMGEKAALQ